VTTGAADVGFSTTLFVAIGVWVGLGVSVIWMNTLVGVHEGTKVNRGVTVMVAVALAGFKVGGGKGLRLLFGLKNISAKYDTTQRNVTNIKMVNTFHTLPAPFFLLGGSLASDISYESMLQLPKTIGLGQQDLDLTLILAFAYPCLNGLHL